MAATYATNKAVASNKATIRMKDTGSTFITIGDVTGITHGGFDTAVVDVTHSLSQFNEVLGGRVSVGDITADLNLSPSSTEWTKILANSGKVADFEIHEDGTSSTSAKAAFKALVKSFSWKASGENTVFSGTLTLTVSGPLTYTAGTP